MALEVNNRKYDRLHEKKPFHDGTETIWAEAYSKLTPFHYRDGVTIWVSRHDLTPDDDFLGQSVGTSSEQPPSDED